MSSSSRLLKAFSRAGIDLVRDGSIVVAHRSSDGATASILSPPSQLLEEKAVRQLLDLSLVAGPTCLARATPDFHPGHNVPVGAIIAAPPDTVIPAAVGTDIGCGMRLYDTGLSLKEVEAREKPLTDALTHALLHNGRDVPMTADGFAALFDDGPAACLNALPDAGLWQKADHQRMIDEIKASVGLANLGGSSAFAPEALLSRQRGIMRDPALGTPGSGNHFVELQVADAILDRHAAWRHGFATDRVMLMIHTGSRDVGFYVGNRWQDQAKKAWPQGTPHPSHGLYRLDGKKAEEYLLAMGNAARYAWLNRVVLGEMVRDCFQRVFGVDKSRLAVDVPHNVISAENGFLIHRKGATPAHQGALALIPGSMGDYSFVAEGKGHPDWLWSCSHGAGRSLRRQAARERAESESRLPWRCISSSPDRQREEAPAAYKDVRPVIDAQEEAGLLTPVLRLRPWVTFKT